MPQIGSDSDELDWKLVSRIIDEVFENSGIQLTIYMFNQENQQINP